jgi:hypothetical protein
LYRQGFKHVLECQFDTTMKQLLFFSIKGYLDNSSASGVVKEAKM